MKKIFVIAAALAAVTLTQGCASSSYEKYADSQTKLADTRGATKVAKYEAMAKVAAGGNDTIKTAVAMAMAFDKDDAPSTLQAPVNEVLQWAQALAPLAGQGLQGLFGYRLGVVQSNNGVKTEGIRYGAMSNIAGAGIEAAGKVEQVKPCIITEAVLQC